MVQLTPKVITRIQGCKSFGFKTRNHVQQSSHLNSRSPMQRLAQNMLIAAIVTALQQFQSLPCDLTMTVGAKSGRSILDGNVEPYEQSSKDAASDIIQEVTVEAYRFAQQYSDSSFSVTYSQGVTITTVDR